jgi:hypothetical protein
VPNNPAVSIGVWRGETLKPRAPSLRKQRSPTARKIASGNVGQQARLRSAGARWRREATGNAALRKSLIDI